MTKDRILTLITVVVLSVPAMLAQWTLDYHKYQYDMGAYIDVKANGELVDLAANKIGAFVGDECRGIGELVELDGAERNPLYLRIYSNLEKGETVSFKMLDAAGKEWMLVGAELDFQKDALIGSPSEPYLLDCKAIDVMPGDANGDGDVTMSDVAAAIDYYLEKKPARFILEAADINGDGLIQMSDVASIIDIVLGKRK